TAAPLASGELGGNLPEDLVDARRGPFGGGRRVLEWPQGDDALGKVGALDGELPAYGQRARLRVAKLKRVEACAQRGAPGERGEDLPAERPRVQLFFAAPADDSAVAEREP